MRVPVVVLVCLLFLLGPAAAEDEKKKAPKRTGAEMTEAERKAVLKKAEELDKEIQALVKELENVPTDGLPAVSGYSKATAEALKGYTFDREALGARGLGYEKLDQLTIEVILGVR